jgi:hypothetical protein
MFEVAEPVELGELLFAGRRERVPVSRSHLEEVLGADGRFKVDVQFDFGNG